LQEVETRERAELERRAARFRPDAPMIPLEGRAVVIVDDGLATGSTARAAIQVARAHGASWVVLAVPVAPHETLAELAPVADDIVCVASPRPFVAIGQWYDDFRQTSDAEVSRLLAEAR
jgi:putative phosphoribosyl transferase